MTPQRTYFVFSQMPNCLGENTKNKISHLLITEMITRNSLYTQTAQLTFLKLITNLDSLILKIHFEATHFCFNAEPKSVQLAHYQSKKKKRRLNKVTTFNVTKSWTAKYHKLKTSNTMWLCYLAFTKECIVSQALRSWDLCYHSSFVILGRSFAASEPNTFHRFLGGLNENVHTKKFCKL